MYQEWMEKIPVMGDIDVNNCHNNNLDIKKVEEMKWD